MRLVPFLGEDLLLMVQVSLLGILLHQHHLQCVIHKFVIVIMVLLVEVLLMQVVHSNINLVLCLGEALLLMEHPLVHMLHP